MALFTSAQAPSPAATGDAASPPSFASGFGTLMEQERRLQSSTEHSLAALHGPHCIASDGLLRDHRTRLGANIALLEQRYERLPHPERFQALHAPLPRLHRSVVLEDVGPLPNLVAQHLAALTSIETLIAHRSGGPRGEPVLTKVARNHEDMAWTLTTLLRTNEPEHRSEPSPPITPGAIRCTSEEAWENEGGASESFRAPPLHPGRSAD